MPGFHAMPCSGPALRDLTQVFNELQGNTWSSLAQLRSCIGDVDGDADNTLMEEEMRRQRGNTETGEVR